MLIQKASGAILYFGLANNPISPSDSLGATHPQHTHTQFRQRHKFLGYVVRTHHHGIISILPSIARER